MSIFRENAPLYWAAGLPVIPLKRWNSSGKGAGKAPILNEWTQYGQHMPTEAVRGHWLESYPDSNIGLPFGPSSGLCAIDIDTENSVYIEAIKKALPTSPWVRVGKKGMGLIFKWQGQRNFKLRDADNASIVEFLGQGNQMVLPPSIHPDTGKPYVANVPLWEVLEQIQPVPPNIEQVLRDALGVSGVSLAETGRSGPIDVVPQGQRDIQLVRFAGYLARVVLGIDKNTKFPLKEAMEQMRTWVENFTAHASDDDMDPDKGVAKLVEFLLKDVEKGRTLPNGWDNGLTDEQRGHPAIAAMIEKNAVQRWTVSKARAFLRESLEDVAGDDDKTMAVIFDLIESVAKDENFSEFDFKSIVHDIQEKAKPIKLGKADLVSAFKQARKGDVEQAADHEAIARQVAEEIERGGELKHDQGMFWQWDGAAFSRLEDDDVYMMIAEGVKGNALARRHTDYLAITKTVQKMKRSPLASELEPGINFANGFLDTNLELHGHSAVYGKTFTMPFNYVEARAGEAHKWLEYLERSWGDDEDYGEKVLALQEAFAATMFGIAPQYQRAFLLHGKAKTGKTQAMEVLRAMMPPAAQSSVAPNLWAERFQLSPMVGKTLNICGELAEESVINGRSFKEIVEGTPQNTEYKGQDIFIFKPLAAQWFASNHLPRSRDTSGGFTRRWLIFDFTHEITSEERVIDFWRVLIAEEREAIAAWAVQGLQRLQRQREYTLPHSHFIRINQVVRSNNSVAAWLQSSDRVRPTENDSDSVNVRNAFDQYVSYMRDVSKGWNVTYERFIQMLEDLGHNVFVENDGVGVMTHRARKLRMITPTLPVR